jgi:MFS family permease
VFGFFGGTFVNKLGVKLTLSFGGIGYCIYAISLLVSVHQYVPGFNIFAGALLGVCAGLLWTAQGTIMISYPHEEQKGRYFAWFWAIFNMGAVIGSLVRIFRVSHMHLDAMCILMSPSQSLDLTNILRFRLVKTSTLRQIAQLQMALTSASSYSCSSEQY